MNQSAPEQDEPVVVGDFAGPVLIPASELGDFARGAAWVAVAAVLIAPLLFWLTSE